MELRSELKDELAHWGLFALPLAGYLLVLMALQRFVSVSGTAARRNP